MRKLEEIVREFYIESLGASQTDERYPRFLQIAISGLRDLNQDIKSISTDALLPVNDNLTVDLPSDYIDYELIGIVRNGRILSFGLNSNAAPLPLDDCGNSLVASDINTDSTSGGGSFIGYNSAAFNKDGQFVGRRFGLGGGGNSLGTYKVFKSKGYIALNNFSGDEIILRYMSNLEQVDGNFVVDPFMVESLKAWMWWKYIQRSRSYGGGEKQLAQADYNKEKRKSQIRENRFNMPEFFNAYKSGYRSAPKM
jgi:hypothetical protein